MTRQVMQMHHQAWLSFCTGMIGGAVGTMLVVAISVALR